MAIVINGSGTVTGLAVGGLPDGTVDAGTLATNSVDSAELVDGSIDSSHLASGVGGKVLQCVSAYSTTQTICGTSYATVAGTSLTITPSATSSKIMLFFSSGGLILDNSSIQSISLRINSSEDGVIMFRNRHGYADTATYKPFPLELTYIDAPSSTSAITYTVTAKVESGGDWTINPDDTAEPDNVNSLTAIALEIGA